MAGRAQVSGAGSSPLQTTEHNLLIIEGRFYDDIGNALIAGAEAECQATGTTFERIAVPGALEIPQVLAQAIATGKVGRGATVPNYSGVVALGCIIRGETYHFDIVCDNANHWLMELATRYAIPVGNGILTVDTREQALTRARGGREGKGADAVRACLRLCDISLDFGKRDL
ncbi:MAG: 6,7-dimethyl-8-ribityllumazine synthase [Hyphomicrobiaceae bacterium]